MKQRKIYTGGAEGTDLYAEAIGRIKGIKVSVLTFSGHRTVASPANLVLLNSYLLEEGWEQVKKTNRVLNRNIEHLSRYTKNLLARNWHIIERAEVIYAFSEIENKKEGIVKGGTGWGVMMAIQEEKPLYVYNTNDNMWYFWDDGFQLIDPPIDEHETIAIIGTRKINQSLKNAMFFLV